MDYYEILDIDRSASASEIKKAYRKQALKYHPDKNAGDDSAEKQFKKISEAYEVLGNPEKKSMYDQYGEAGISDQGGQAGFGSMEDALRTFMGAFGGRDSGVFESFFGGAGHCQQSKGASKRVRLKIPFLDAVNGCVKKILLKRRVICDTCKGEGTKDPNSKRNCGGCNGTGQVTQSRGFFHMTSVCPHCNGEGLVITDPCRSCGGEGSSFKQSSVDINIPAGIDSGMRMKISGAGDMCPGGIDGDLYIDVTVQKHDYFERDGENVHVKCPISFGEATLGVEKKVSSLEGKDLLIKIPKGVEYGQKLRIPGRGIKGVNGSKGHLYVEVIIETPKHLSSEQVSLLEAFMSSETPRNYPKKASFFEKIKSFFSV